LQPTPSKEGYLMDTSLIEGINSFASLPDRAFLIELCDRIEALETENRRLKARISEIEDYQDDHTRAINENAAALNKIWQGSKARTPKGSKTKKRIEKLDLMLKTGAKALRQIEKDLGISPQEMSRLISKLDKRRYQIFIRNGDKREKVIKLRTFNI
jgi:DNA repair exonuclease SbcCD ATPase subunit